MKIEKVIVRHFGGPERLEFEWTDLENPKPDEDRVLVLASAVSGADINMRRGLYPFQPKAPLTPGYVVIGRSEKTGGRVACLTVTGGYATAVNLPTQFLVPVPDGLSDEVAAALVLDGMTAYQMLNRKLRLQNGQRVFIHGASGAVGSALARLARAKGLEVFGTASLSKHSLVQTWGVKPFEYRNQHWIQAVQDLGGVDAVFDPLGFESFDRSWQILRPGGILVGYGFNNQGFQGKAGILPNMVKFISRNLLFWTRKRTSFYGINRRSPHFRSDLEDLFNLGLKGSFQPLIKGVFSFSKIQDAHRAWEKSEGVGSIIIKMET